MVKASWATGKALAYTSREGTGSDSGVHRAPLAANRQTVEGWGRVGRGGCSVKCSGYGKVKTVVDRTRGGAEEGMKGELG